MEKILQTFCDLTSTCALQTPFIVDALVLKRWEESEILSNFRLELHCEKLRREENALSSSPWSILDRVTVPSRQGLWKAEWPSPICYPKRRLGYFTHQRCPLIKDWCSYLAGCDNEVNSCNRVKVSKLTFSCVANIILWQKFEDFQ